MNKQIITVSGNSMYPAILQNDKVFISRKDDYDAGAILVYVYRSEQYLIHRFLRCINKIMLKTYWRYAYNVFKLLGEIEEWKKYVGY